MAHRHTLPFFLIVALAAGVSGAVDRVVPGRGQSPTQGVAPRLVPALDLQVQLGAPLELGQVPRGRRRIVPITGGTFEGPTIKGRVLPGGADWQIVRADGFTELDTRYALETDQGHLVYIQNAGIRHAPPDVTAKILAGPGRRSVARVYAHRADVRDVRAGVTVVDPVHFRRDRRTASNRSRDSCLARGVIRR